MDFHKYYIKVINWQHIQNYILNNMPILKSTIDLTDDYGADLDLANCTFSSSMKKSYYSTDLNSLKYFKIHYQQKQLTYQ